MKTILSFKQIDKILRPYWDLKIGSCELKLNDNWFGFFNSDNNLIVGHHLSDKSLWYYDSNEFIYAPDIFSLHRESIRYSMMRYLENKYNFKIIRLI